MKYVLGMLGVILVVVLAIILISRGGNKDKPPAGQQGKRVVKVSEQAKQGTSVQFTTQGKLVGEVERRAIRITITQEERKLDILTGYEEAVERTQVYPNTQAAYETFMTALDYAGLSRERKALTNDERAVCPMGRRYIYELKEYSQELIRLWDTSCGNKWGTFGGDEKNVRQLFQAQIPEYAKQIKGVKLN